MVLSRHVTSAHSDRPPKTAISRLNGSKFVWSVNSISAAARVTAAGAAVGSDPSWSSSSRTTSGGVLLDDMVTAREMWRHASACRVPLGHSMTEGQRACKAQWHGGRLDGDTKLSCAPSVLGLAGSTHVHVLRVLVSFRAWKQHTKDKRYAYRTRAMLHTVTRHGDLVKAVNGVLPVNSP